MTKERKHTFEKANFVRMGDLADAYIVAWWVDSWIAMPVCDEPVGVFCVDVEIEPGVLKWVACNLVTTISWEEQPYWSLGLDNPVSEPELCRIQSAMRYMFSWGPHDHIAPKVEDPEYGAMLQDRLVEELFENWNVRALE